MTASMTAFSRQQTETNGGQLIWEIRSVNHRFLDTHLKLPEELRVLETACRDKINNRLNRGRVDAILKYERSKSTVGQITVNTGALDALNQAMATVREHVSDTAPITPTEILKWPGVLAEPEQDIDSITKGALDCLAAALDGLLDARHREGDRMQLLISDRIKDSRLIVSGLIQELPSIELDIKQRWQRRLDELGDPVDPARIAQELALMLTRNDVSEELDRLETHFDEVERVLATDKPAGRRLDFLMQELNREANTLGSKSVDLRNTSASVELKVLIDQMREQVQNIE